MAEETYATGDVVYPRCGGPGMTVIAVNTEAKAVNVRWFDVAGVVQAAWLWNYEVTHSPPKVKV